MIHKRNNTKIIFLIMLVCLSMLAFAGCGSKAKSGDTKSTTVKSTAQKANDQNTDESKNTTENQEKNSKAQNSTKPEQTTNKSVKNTTSANTKNGNTIVYYVPGSTIYHFNRTDSTIKNNKNVHTMTLSQAKSKKMQLFKEKVNK
ncbi:outer membrane murein-binding lipoprotein Lpp [Clostridium algifaecis]|uniref:Outer membrane murein-binding lipoprotein Lpp n=1 Tax=Clostridium algifaecis TaxID=1472040 RepID=A0ABS4KS21_9CLOT|nr:hypothetical protein [Clostridium algifaecis]MBP2032836.1 outer membrane murein-binding lipoprotein Lpp [Clostridium algifaecis]